MSTFILCTFLHIWLAPQSQFFRMQKKMSCPQSKLFSTHFFNLCFWESQSTMFSTHDRPSCPISEASNRLRLFNNLLLLQIFEIFMNCWIIRSAGELGHFKTCQFHDFGPQQVNIQLWSSSSRKAVILFLQLWKLCWCNWRGGITIFLHFLQTPVHLSPTAHISVEFLFLTLFCIFPDLAQNFKPALFFAPVWWSHFWFHLSGNLLQKWLRAFDPVFPSEHGAV